MTTESSKNGAITLTRTNFSGYVRHMGVVECFLLHAVQQQDQRQGQDQLQCVVGQWLCTRIYTGTTFRCHCHSSKSSVCVYNPNRTRGRISGFGRFCHGSVRSVPFVSGRAASVPSVRSMLSDGPVADQYQRATKPGASPPATSPRRVPFRRCCLGRVEMNDSRTKKPREKNPSRQMPTRTPSQTRLKSQLLQWFHFCFLLNFNFFYYSTLFLNMRYSLFCAESAVKSQSINQSIY